MRIRKILNTGILNIVFQVVFLGAVYILGRNVVLNMQESLRLLFLVGLCFVPSAVWTIFYYLQDRAEPEPIRFIAVSFFSGLSAAGLFIIPVQKDLYHLPEWIYASGPLFLLGSYLVSASLVSIFLYIIIRYGFYPLREFDEPVDGMIYGAMAGAGMAFVLSLDYLAGRPEYTLFTIAYTASINILIYSAVGAKLGEVLGRAKFRRSRTDFHAFWGVFFSVLLLGTYHTLNEFIFLSGYEQSFWLSFVLTLLFSLSIILFCYSRMQKLVRPGYLRENKISSKFDSATAVLILILILAGAWVSIQSQKGRKLCSSQFGFCLYYPYSLYPFTFTNPENLVFSLLRDSNILFSAENGTPRYSFVIKSHKKNSSQDKIDLYRYIDVTDTESLGLNSFRMGGKSWRRISYSYMENNGRKEWEFPHLMKVYSDFIEIDDCVLMFMFKAPAEDFNEGIMEYEKILQSIRWKAE